MMLYVSCMWLIPCMKHVSNLLLHQNVRISKFLPSLNLLHTVIYFFRRIVVAYFFKNTSPGTVKLSLAYTCKSMYNCICSMHTRSNVNKHTESGLRSCVTTQFISLTSRSQVLQSARAIINSYRKQSPATNFKVKSNGFPGTYSFVFHMESYNKSIHLIQNIVF